MIYGYTYKAPWIGSHTMLYCKNVSWEIHNKIWNVLFLNGGSWLTKDNDGQYNQPNWDVRHDSKYQIVQYGGPDNVINHIINKFNIEIIETLNQQTVGIKKVEKDVIKQIDLAIKLES